MSLKIFHFLFILIVLGLSVFLLVYGIRHYYQTSIDHSLGLGMAIFGGALVLLLVPYLFWFQKKVRKLSFIIGLLLSRELLACPVCFGDPNSLMVQGTKTGILFLIGLISFLLLVMTSIGISWYFRSKKV